MLEVNSEAVRQQHSPLGMLVKPLVGDTGNTTARKEREPERERERESERVFLYFLGIPFIL